MGRGAQSGDRPGDPARDRPPVAPRPAEGPPRPPPLRNRTHADGGAGRGGLKPSPLTGERREIGRASCRERVCQYVLIAVVAVSVKKKDHLSTEQLRYETQNKQIYTK